MNYFNNIKSEANIIELYEKVSQTFSLTLVNEICIIALNDIVLQKKLFDSFVIHQNGFHKLILYEDPNGWKIRLHLWKVNNLLDNLHIHDHNGIFISKILMGNLTNNIYGISDYGEQYYKYIFKFNLKTKECNFETSKLKSQLKLIKTNMYHAKQTYIINPNDLHIAIPSKSQDTMTMVFQGNEDKGYSNLYSKTKIPVFNDVIKPNKTYFLAFLEYVIQLSSQMKY